MARLILIFVSAVFLTAPAAFAQDGACPHIDTLRATYQGLGYISLDFIQLVHSDVFNTVDTIPGSLSAGGGGRFRMSLPGRLLVSNGVLYWSYSEENKQVLVDSVAKIGSWDPLTLLYDPEKVYRCRAEKIAGDTIEFDMAAVDSATVPAAFTLSVRRRTYVPEKLIYLDDNDSRIVVLIRHFARVAHLADSQFEFHPAPGVEVIDMP
jgi:outer membrane lipoprotein-sorting protein